MSDPRDDEVSRLRVPPHSAEAEQAVLGALLLDPTAYDRVGDVLLAKDFYRYEHRLIFESVSRLANSMRAVDALTVFDELTRQGKEAECGGMAYLGGLTESVASAANIRRYAEIVRERSVRRQMIAVLDEAVGAMFRGDDEPLPDQIDAVATKIAEIERGGTSTKEPKLLSDILVKRIDHVNDVHENGTKAGWESGVIPWLDRKLNGGFRPGNFYVLAARPSIGKSSLAEAIGLAMAGEGHPVLFLSQEMPEEELADRAIAELGGVDYGHLQTAELDEIEWGMLSNGVEAGARLPFYVDDTPALTMRQITQKARRVKGLRLLILDYLQLSEGESKGRDNNRAAEIGSISRGLKKLAKQLRCSVLALSQLNRKVEERPGKRPTMADLRDSGEIEQDADVIMFLWPVREYGKTDGKLIGLELGKNRQGQRGEVGLNFRGKYQRWEESTESTRSTTTGSNFS